MRDAINCFRVASSLLVVIAGCDSFDAWCRFCVGDRFYLCDNQILCEYDYEEGALFGSGDLNQVGRGGAGSPSFVVFQQRPSAQQEVGHPKAGQRVPEQQPGGPLTSSPRCPSPGDRPQPRQQQPEQGDASSSGYGSPDSSGGLVDEG